MCVLGYFLCIHTDTHLNGTVEFQVIHCSSHECLWEVVTSWLSDLLSFFLVCFTELQIIIATTAVVTGHSLLDQVSEKKAPWGGAERLALSSSSSAAVHSVIKHSELVHMHAFGCKYRDGECCESASLLLCFTHSKHRKRLPIYHQ